MKSNQLPLQILNMKRKKTFFTWITSIFLLLSFSPSFKAQNFNSDDYFVDQDNETEFTESYRQNGTTTADFVFETITNLVNFFKSENITDILEEDDEIEVTTTLSPLFEGEEVTESPEYRFLFPNKGDSISSKIDYVDEETQSCTDYVANSHYNLEANGSLHFSLNSWMHRSIVQTSSNFEIIANGSCLIFGSEADDDEKPNFSNFSFVRALPKNTTVSVFDSLFPGNKFFTEFYFLPCYCKVDIFDVTDEIRVAVHCEAPFPVFFELNSKPSNDEKPGSLWGYLFNFFSKTIFSVRREINIGDGSTDTNLIKSRYGF